MNKKQMEQSELNLLTGKPAFKFQTKKKSILRYFGKPYRTWSVQYNELGLMDIQSELFFKMNVNEADFQKSNAMADHFRAVKDNSKIAAEVVAVSVLGSKWRIRLFRKIMADYFYWRINSKQLLELVNEIFKMNHYQDFTISIVLMNANRVTNPEPPKAVTIED